MSFNCNYTLSALYKEYVYEKLIYGFMLNIFL